MRDAFFFVFYCNSNECFAFGTKTSFSWPFSAHIDLVVQTMGSTLDFYQTTQLISARPYHRAMKFLQPLPTIVISAQVKKSLQSESPFFIFLTSG